MPFSCSAYSMFDEQEKSYVVYNNIIVNEVLMKLCAVAGMSCCVV